MKIKRLLSIIEQVRAILNEASPTLNTPPPPTTDENEDFDVIDVTTVAENTEEQS